MSLTRILDSKSILKRIAKDYVSYHLSKIVIALLFMIVAALCSALIVWLIKPAIDRILINHDRNMMILMPLVIFLLHLTKGISEYIQSYIIKYVGHQIITDMQVQMYKHLLISDLSFIQSQAGRLISRLTNDIVLIRDAVSHILVGCAKHLLSVLFLIIIMFSLEPYLSILIFLVFPIAVYYVQKLGIRMKQVTNNVQEELSKFTHKLDESLFAIKVIKSFCIEKIQTEEARKITGKIFQFYKKSAILNSLTSPVMETLNGLVVAFILLYGGYSVIEDKMTTGALFAFIASFVSAYRPFKSLLTLNVTLQEGIAGANRIFNILDLKPSIINSRNALFPNFSSPVIEFKDVSLNFAGRSAVRSFNLTLEQGKTYALIGKSGSGKSSIINMLVRFFDTTSGKIFINSNNLKEIDIKHLRSNIGLVTQETMLFNASVIENISHGIENIKLQDVINVAKTAEAHEFITKLSNGYDTVIGSSGFTLSGGQRQRLAIARALLKNASILLLDEATNSLDPTTERRVMKAITNYQKHNIVLIITHRLSNIVNADQIIVMKEGAKMQQGTHNELISTNGEYKTLMNNELQQDIDSV